MTKVASVSEYIKSQPKENQAKLKELRSIITSLAPDAEEMISYGMPYYKYFGRFIYWGAFQNHFSLFVATGTFVENLSPDLKKHFTSKGTIQFSYDKKLPVALVKKIVKLRVKENELKRKK